MVEWLRSRIAACADAGVKSSPSKSENCRVFVGSKLPEYTNEQHIKDHFQKFAAHIVNVELIRNRHTNQFKGFGFIIFSTHCHHYLSS